MSLHSSEGRKLGTFNPVSRGETNNASEIFKLGALKLQDISFSNFMTFSVSAFGLISTDFL